MDNTFYKMKESKLIELKNKVDALTGVVRNLIHEVHSCISTQLKPAINNIGSSVQCAANIMPAPI